MEAAIRWASGNQQDGSRRFLVADVAKNRLQYGEIEDVSKGVVSSRWLSQRDKLPNFTAFDWSRDNDSLVAIGTSIGDCRVINIDPDSPSTDVASFPVKLQRKANSLSFSRNGQLAVGLDRIRGDTSLNIYDLASRSSEPVRRLTGAEVITNVKYFSDQPQTLVAGSGGVARYGQNLKLFDLRDHVSATVATIATRHVHLISLDPLDENYLASAGPATDNVLSVWDKRRLSSMETAASPGQASTAVLQIDSVLRPVSQPSVWSLRYSGYKRGAFAVLSGDGQVRYFDTTAVPHESYNHSQLYVKRTHDLVSMQAREASVADPVIGFDHINPSSFGNRHAILTIRQSRNLNTFEVTSSAPKANMTAIGNVAVTYDSATFTCALRKAGPKLIESVSSLQVDDNPRSHLSGEAAHLSSRERHRRFVEESLDAGKASLLQALHQMDLHRQRCLSGYMLDCEKNIAIVKDDPWLVELWEIVKRLQRMAANRGMVEQGADLSYFGVHDLWFGQFKDRPQRLKRPPPSQEDYAKIVRQILARHRYSDFEGVETKFPARRQLALAICGWKFDERRLRKKCSDIIGRKEYYKAIIVAVAHGRKDIAMDLLKTLSRTKAIENSALAAVIACTAVSDEQRDLCDWMAEEAEDPYLKALLAYFVSGSWRSVVGMVELPLQYRVAIGLKYLEDDALGHFLSGTMTDVVAAGDTEGIILTGLTESSIDLFQNYIVSYNDVQTAVLATACTNPHLTKGGTRWDSWMSTYFEQMQAWSTFKARVHFVNQHNRMVNDYLTNIRPTLVPEALNEDDSFIQRCSGCKKAIIRPKAKDSTSEGYYGQKKPKRTSGDGMLCPRCSRNYSRCEICLHWQGSPRMKISMPSERDVDNSPRAKLIGLCNLCSHAFHVQHATEWFAKHERCPVPACLCACDMQKGPLCAVND